MAWRRIARAVPLLVLFVIAGRGCGGTKECASDNDCSSSEVCSFPTSGCATKGTCASWSNPCDGPLTQACDCRGQPILIACGYPGAPEPIQNLGACVVPSGGPCKSADDCDPRALCAFRVADGCDAKGTCVLPDATCMKPGVMACGCDGQPVGLACTFGEGNAPAPVRSLGPCGGGDAGGDGASDAATEASSDAASE